jgi:hypothetical protein
VYRGLFKEGATFLQDDDVEDEAKVVTSAKTLKTYNSNLNR